jgi:hypothetical protein
LLLVFAGGFLPVLLFLIISPILQQHYLIDCRDTTEKIFTACNVDESSWQLKIDKLLHFLSVLGSPLLIGFLTTWVVLREKRWRELYFILPPLMLILLLALVLLINSILSRHSISLSSQQDYPLSLAFTSLLTSLLTFVINIASPRTNHLKAD